MEECLELRTEPRCWAGWASISFQFLKSIYLHLFGFKQTHWCILKEEESPGCSLSSLCLWVRMSAGTWATAACCCSCCLGRRGRGCDKQQAPIPGLPGLSAACAQ